MRKSKCCVETMLQQKPLMMRTCMLHRLHDGPHLDKHGRWQSTRDRPAEYSDSQEDK